MHLEAVTGIEEEEQTPKIAVIRRDDTKDLVEAVTKLVNQLSVDDKQRENRRNQSRERSSSWNGGVTKDVIEDSNKIVGSTIGGDFQRQELVTETDLSEEMNCLGGTKGRVSSAEPVEKKDTFRGIAETVPYVEVPNTCKETALLKRKTTENCNVIRVRPTNTIKCLNAEIKLHGNRCVGLLDSGSSISL